MSRAELDQILRRARRALRAGAPPVTSGSPPPWAKATSPARLDALNVARDAVAALEQQRAAPQLMALVTALVQLEQDAAAAALVRLFADRAPPAALAALDLELRTQPEVAAALGLRAVPLTSSDGPGVLIDPLPVVAITPGPRARPAQVAGVERLARALAPLARREGLEITGAPLAPPPWFELEWSSDEQHRPFAIPPSPADPASPLRLVETLELREHLSATWLDDPRLVLEPLHQALTLVRDAAREVMTPLPPWYADAPDQLMRVLYGQALFDLPGLLAGWADLPAARRVALASGGLRLLLGASRPAGAGPAPSLDAARALEAALREVIGPDFSGGLRFAGIVGAAGLEKLEARLEGAPEGAPTGEAPVRLRRTLDDLWAVAESREVGLVVSAVARGLLPLEATP